jgi:uncharacterized repeat protein (TIGR01451 family)
MLSASATGGSVFAGWTGDCSGAGASVNIILDMNRRCSATFRRTVALGADLSLETGILGTAALGSYVSVTGKVSNLGPTTASNAILRFKLPAGVSFSTGTRGCRHTAGVVTCPLRDLPAGTGVIKRVRIRLNAKGRQDVQIATSSSSPDPIVTNNRRTVTTVVP